MKRLLEKNSLLFIVFLSLLLRLVWIDQGLWLDEAIGALEVKRHGFWGILTIFIRNDNHPPLYYLLLEAWTRIFGFSDFAIRSLSVILGVLNVLVLVKVAQLVFPNKKGLQKAVGLFLATSPFHIYYSQEARMYIVAAFLTCLSIYSFLKLVKGQSLFDWILFSFSITATVFTDYLPFFILPALWLFALLRIRDSGWWRSFLLSHLPIFVLGLLWLPTFFIQLSSGGWLVSILPAWAELAGGATLKNLLLVWMKFILGRISLLPKYFYYALIVLASLPFVFVFLQSLKKFKKFLIIFLWFFIPLFLGFVFSFIFPAFYYFRFLFIYPAFVLLLFVGLLGLTRNKKKILFSILIFCNLVGFYFYVADENQRREQWREATRFLEKSADEDAVVVFIYPEPFAAYRWYQRGIIKAYGVTDSISANKDETLKITKKAISDKSKVYQFSYLEDLTDPQGLVRQTLRESGFRITKTFSEFKGVGLINLWEKEEF